MREPEELLEARVDGALHIPMNEVPDRLDELDPARPVAVLCRVGSRSAYVAQYLARAGFDAHNVDGGIVRWARSGLPLHV